MRIAITGAHQAVIGGAETYLSWLLRTLVARGHDVAFGFERAAAPSEDLVDRHLEPLTRWNIGALSRSDFLAQVASFRPDIVFLQAASDETLDLELSARFRSVLFAHAFYGTCATGWKVHHLPRLTICSRAFGTACLPINYIRGCGGRSPVQLLTVYRSQRARNDVLKRLAGLVVASEYMRQIYVQNGVTDRPISVLPPPVNVDLDSNAPVARQAPSRLLFLGRLTKGKGGVRAIEAAARCQRKLGRTLHLTMAGEGPELPRCRRLAQALGLNVAFPGWVDAGKRLELLRDSDLLVVPSQWPEPFGMVGVEAGCFGVPAVGYRAGGIVDWLKPGVSGELADGFGAPALSDALERALRDPRHHHHLQMGAWAIAREFAGERHLSGLETLFESLVSTVHVPAAGSPTAASYHS